ncbi:MAG: TIGR03067 domain-containing protein [Gemmataceae bacterium]|nr:TIGR03067 domain-containing protein [Gemmataceae bacterium]
MVRFALGLVFLSASLAFAQEPAGDLKALQGKWVLQSATLGGRDHTDDFKDMKLAVTGDKYVIDFGVNSDNGAIKINATKTPKQIDLTTGEKGPWKIRNLTGIYELKGDTVTVCFHSTKEERPTKFEAPEKSQIVLITFTRDKN